MVIYFFFFSFFPFSFAYVATSNAFVLSFSIF